MTHEEAIDVLETIADVYPKFEITKKKAKLILPPLKQMDYNGVMDKLAAFVARHPYAPTIAEIAAYPPEPNEYLAKMDQWREDAVNVSAETKERFRMSLLKLIAEKSNHES
ncbi:hypothetical protein QGM71_17615 [Virgibacillus sp. C22-A2]|uniref:Replicative helicase inhibitor G39P N-terminal domain-containing protein n=1 Tax=Virgibacillus tibetensis TaxID=3042313 RepID=A0ABU6KJE5_9BACI|nr:hypothetical protein [Virgibacillus sp. C22-A2]